LLWIIVGWLTILMYGKIVVDSYREIVQGREKPFSRFKLELSMEATFGTIMYKKD